MSADARTIDFRTLLRGTAYRCGLDPDALGTVEAAALAEHLTFAANKAHRHYDWPDVIRTEGRALRQIFSLSASYALGDEVYDPATETYYRAVADGFAGRALSDASYWLPKPDIRRALLLLSQGDTPMAEVLAIYDADPDTELAAQPQGYRLNATEVLLDPDSTVPVVWLRFRVPAPRFTAAPWSAATAYASGDLAYLAPHSYLCLVASTGAGQTPSESSTRWRIQDVPELIEDQVKDSAKAEWLSTQGQDERAIAMRRAVREDLDDATATLSVEQGQTRRYSVATRTNTTRHIQPARTAR